MRSFQRTKGLVVAVLFALTASCAGNIDSGSVDESNAPLWAPQVGPEVRSAMRRDLHLTDAQVNQRLFAEATAANVEPALRNYLGSAFAGAWLDETASHLIVGITDPALAESVRVAGGEPRLVAHSLAHLGAIKADFDQRAPSAGEGIHSWHVDVTTNSVVVEAEDPSAASTQAFVDALGVGPEAVRVVASAERPHPVYDLRGGDEYIINGNTLCSVGFAVNGGFVSAGHCGKAGSPTAGSNWVAMGSIVASTFPGNDWSFIQTNGDWNSLPWVGQHGSGADVRIAGSNVASIGSSVCRSGRTTGWRCGTIQSYDITVNYSNGPVYGLTGTNACAEGGDSGGSFISGDQAQGVTSGASGNCSSGGSTFFQPVNPILNTYGLALKTDGGGGDSIASRLNNKCIDVPGSNFVDGAPLQTYTCNGTGAQRWQNIGGTFQAGGKCMDVAGANTADGTTVQLVNCNGNRAQQFVLNSAGDLVSILANKCVDVSGWNANDGARLIIWPCHGGANQKWYRR